tara:strand:+ start:25063 stop:26457 length:1395 start_codon:yes stop_codon:yes gene_type:complete
MATTSQDKFNPSFGTGVQGISIDNNRRTFNFGERVAELAPQQSPFFVYLSKVAKKPTNDPVFKFMEQRHQWQRRNFNVDTNLDDLGKTAGAAFGSNNDLVLSCGYNSQGITEASQPCNFIVGGQTLAIKTSEGVVVVKIKASAKIGSSAGTEGEIVHGASSTTIAGEDIIVVGKDMTGTEDIQTNAAGQVIGTAWAEGSTAPQGWEDALFDREGYCQIFKTAMNLFSNTARATVYRGKADEYKRVWTEKLMEHKMDLEQGFLFGRGVAGHSTEGDTGATSETGGNARYTHGIVPYTEVNGKVYDMSYASSGYDAFLDAMEDYFAPEGGNSGNKLVLASRKVITYLNKLGSGSFMNNSVGSSQYRLDVANIPGQFGHNVTKINTIYGNLHFVAEPLLRGPWEDYAVCVDMKNVAYRPLVGNGVNRDTFVETNIQANDEDGRRDQIITEAGLEISLPETHAVMKWS